MLITNQIQLSFLFCPNHSSNNRNVIVYLPDFVPTSPACVVRIEELSSGAISSELPTGAASTKWSSEWISNNTTQQLFMQRVYKTFFTRGMFTHTSAVTWNLQSRRLEKCTVCDFKFSGRYFS